MMNFVYSKKDLIVSSIAVSIVIILVGIGFGFASGKPLGEEDSYLSTQLNDSRPFDSEGTDLYKAALEILNRFPVIDGHNDLAWSLRLLVQNDLRKVNLGSFLSAKEPWKSHGPDHTDLIRLRKGKIGGQFWSAYVGCDSQFKDATAKFLEQIDVIKRFVKAYPEDFQFATSPQDIEEAFKAKKIASMIGLESGHAIDNKLGALRMMYELGARYMTLTHTCNTPWSDTASSEDIIEPRAFGLTSFGETVILEMNRLGMMVDLSHVSNLTMKSVLKTTLAPVIFSHSSARALYDNPRNVPDDVLQQVTRNGGIVMVNAYSCYLADNCQATINDVVDHINYIREVAGVDHVGIGADFNGVSETPVGFEDTSKYPNLFAELLKQGWTEEELAKLANLNLIRVFKDVEAVRDELANDEPHQRWIPEADLRPEEKSCVSETG